jgi:hypothetical protein
MGLVERRRHTLQHTLQRTLQHTLQNTLQHPVHSCGDLWEGGGVCTKTEPNSSSNAPRVTFWTFYCQKWWVIWSTYISRSMTFSIVRIAFMSRTLKRGSITLTYTHENTHTHTHTHHDSLPLSHTRAHIHLHTHTCKRAALPTGTLRDFSSFGWLWWWGRSKLQVPAVGGWLLSIYFKTSKPTYVRTTHVGLFFL